MFIKREQYRDFEGLRLLWFERPGGPKAPEAGKESAEQAEAEKPDVKDQSEEIAKHRKEAERYIRVAIGAIGGKNKADRAKNQEAYRSIYKKMSAHLKARFDKISQEYNTQREAIGSIHFDESEQAKKLEAEAKTELTKIKARIDSGHDKYSRHQAQQDRIDAARKQKEEAKTPKAKKAAEKEIQAAKEDIILDFLKTHEDTKEMDPAMMKMLATFIVKYNMVQLEAADIDDYTGDIHSFFDEIDKFSGKIESALEGRIGQVVTKFLERMPNAGVGKKEKAAIKEIIQGNEELVKKFGTKENLDKIVNIIAKRFDIRFYSNGEMAYATDLIARPKVITHDPEGFKNRVLLDLQNMVNTPEGVKEYGELVDDQTEWLNKRREKIRNGTFGKINSWDDWEGHEQAEYLLRIHEGIDKRADTIREARGSKIAQERAERQREAKKDAYYDAAEAADLSTATSRLIDLEGYGLAEDKGTPDFKTTFEGYRVYENKTENIKITTHLDDKGHITVTVEPVDAKEGYYKAEQKWTDPSKFKGTDLAKLAKKSKENWIKNNEEISRVNKAIAVKVDGLDIKFDEGETNERYKDDFKLENPKLVYQGHEVGHLEFSKPTDKDKEGYVTLYIDGKKVGAKFRPRALEAKLKQRVPKMKEIAQRAEKNKKEITEKWNGDVNKVKAAEGLKFSPAKKIEGEFKNPDAEIKVGDFSKKDKTEAASLYIKVGSKPEERKYILKVGEKKHEFATIDDVNKFVESNKAELAKVPEKKPEPPKLREGGEKAKENLSKIVMKLWGEKMAGIDPKDPQFNTALNTFINKLTVQRLNELKKPDAVDKFTLTDVEQKDLQEAFTKAYGFDKLEAVDEKEVKALSDMEVKIGDKTQKFSEAFGTNFAKVLSMHLEMKAGNKPGEIQVKDGDKFVSVDAKGLAKYVPAKLRSDYEKILKGEAVDGFDKKAADQLKAQKTMKDLSDIMKSPAELKKKAKSFGKMGLPELVASLGQLWKMFQEAMQTGDFKTLQDALDDFNKGRNPAERIESAKEAYSEAVGKIEDTGELMELYNDPYGEKASALFAQKGKAAVPYRIQLKQVIEEKLEAKLGVDISSMEKKSAGVTKIRASKGADVFVIYVERSGTQTNTWMDKVENRPDGTEYTKPEVGKSEVKNLDTGDRSLAYVLFKESPKEPGKSKEAPSKPGKGTEKAKKYETAKIGTPIDKASKDQKTKGQEKYMEAKGFYESKNYEKAIQTFTEALSIVASPNIHMMLIRSLIDGGKKEEATAEANSFRNFMDSNPQLKGKYKKAIDDVKEYMETTANEYLNKAIDEINKDNYKAALPLLELADSAKKSSLVTYSLAGCHDELGNKEEALKLYKSFLKQDMSDLKGPDKKTYKTWAQKRIPELEAELKKS